MVIGTVGYMSPEQVRGKAIDHRADIFAFGAILYEMLAGKRAFQRSTSADTMSAILNEDPVGISQLYRPLRRASSARRIAAWKRTPNSDSSRPRTWHLR